MSFSDESSLGNYGTEYGNGEEEGMEEIVEEHPVALLCRFHKNTKKHKVNMVEYQEKICVQYWSQAIGGTYTWTPKTRKENCNACACLRSDSGLMIPTLKECWISWWILP